MNKDFNKILSEFLDENRLTQTDFAKAIGVKPSQVSEWIKGKAKPGYDSLRAMATTYNISADFFLGITDTY